MTWLRLAVKVVCSYCGKSLEEKPPFGQLGPDGKEAVSHGACQRCVAKLNHETFGDALPEWYLRGEDGPSGQEKTAAKVDWDLVRSVAEQVRGGAMQGEFGSEMLPTGFLGEDRPFNSGKPYPQQPDLDSGACDQLSEILARRLQALGYKAVVMRGTFHPWPGATERTEIGEEYPGFTHAWVEIDDTGIADLTADQFNSLAEQAGQPPLPRVIMTRVGDERYENPTPLED